MKALETFYNHRMFRSRAEARWAVFFDTLGLQYDYEPEGYDLSSWFQKHYTGQSTKTWYLPDFWLSTLGVWFEVKGGYISDDEAILGAALAEESGAMVLIAKGPPCPDAYNILEIHHEPDRENEWGYFDLGEPSNTDLLRWEDNCLIEPGRYALPRLVFPQITVSSDRAYKAALSARFGT